MEIIVYHGSDLDGPALEALAKEAAGGRAALHTHQCRDREGLLRAMKAAALREGAARDDFFPFKTTGGTQLLQLSQILFFKGRGHRVAAALVDGRELLSRTLRIPTSAFLEPLLGTGQFYQISRSTFINKAHVDSLGPGWVRLDSGESMNVPRSYYHALLRESTAWGMK